MGKWVEVVIAMVVKWIWNALQTAADVHENGGQFEKGFWYGLWGCPSTSVELNYGNGDYSVGPREQEVEGGIQDPGEAYGGEYGNDYYFDYEPIPYPDYVIIGFEKDSEPLKAAQSKRSTVVNPKKQVQERSRVATAENLVYQSSAATTNNYDAILDGVQLGLDVIGLWPGWN